MVDSSYSAGSDTSMSQRHPRAIFAFKIGLGIAAFAVILVLILYLAGVFSIGDGGTGGGPYYNWKDPYDTTTTTSTPSATTKSPGSNSGSESGTRTDSTGPAVIKKYMGLSNGLKGLIAFIVAGVIWEIIMLIRSKPQKFKASYLLIPFGFLNTFRRKVLSKNDDDNLKPIGSNARTNKWRVRGGQKNKVGPEY